MFTLPLSPPSAPREKKAMPAIPSEGAEESPAPQDYLGPQGQR